MKTIDNIIEENKSNHIFKNINDDIIQKIVNRISYHEKNKDTIPVFLCYSSSLKWFKYDMIKDQLNKDIIGYEIEYNNHDNKCDLYILGVFIDGCYFPISNENTFKSIINIL